MTIPQIIRIAGFCGALLLPLAGQGQQQLLSDPVFEVEGSFEDAVGRNDLFFLAARDASAEQPDIEVFRFNKAGDARRIGHYFTTGSTRGMALAGSYLYLANGDNGLEVVDISNPGEPRTAAKLALDGYSHQVRLLGKRAYLASGFGGLYVVDIANPRRPRLIGTYRAFAMPSDEPAGSPDDEGLFPKAGDAGNASGNTDQGYYDADNMPAYEGPEEDISFREFAAKEGVLDLALDNDRAYLAYASAGLYVVDISNPRKPSAMGRLQLSSPVEAVRLNSARLQVTAGIGGVQTIDVSNPAAPRFLWKLRTTCYPQDLAGSRGYTYVADGYCGSDGLLVLDMRTESPQMLESHPGIVGNINTSADYLFAMGLKKTRIYILP